MFEETNLNYSAFNEQSQAIATEKLFTSGVRIVTSNPAEEATTA
jgi:hypothetical protein